MTTERTPGALGSNDGLGVAVLVDGAVVAWLAALPPSGAGEPISPAISCGESTQGARLAPLGPE